MATLDWKAANADETLRDEATGAVPVAAGSQHSSDRRLPRDRFVSRALIDCTTCRLLTLSCSTFTALVDAAMRQYLQRLAPIGDVRRTRHLTALAFAEARAIARTLAGGSAGARRREPHWASSYTVRADPAASFLVESSTDSDIAVFRCPSGPQRCSAPCPEQIAVPADRPGGARLGPSPQSVSARAGIVVRLRCAPARPCGRGRHDRHPAGGTTPTCSTPTCRRLVPLADHAISQFFGASALLPPRCSRASIRRIPRPGPLCSVSETSTTSARAAPRSSLPGAVPGLYRDEQPCPRTERVRSWKATPAGVRVWC